METPISFIEKPEIPSAVSGYRWLFVRLLAAAILLLAAILKAHQLATVPFLGEGLLQARWVNTLVVAFELFLGLWLICGLLPKLTWLLTIGCFSVFATISLYKALSGEASCGCFGTVTVNPWITMGGDLVVMGLLLVSRPNYKSLQAVVSHKRQIGPIAALYFGLCLILGTVVYEQVGQMRYDQLREIGQVLETNVVKLDTDLWIGKELPLRQYIVNGHELMQGEWAILISRPGCSECVRAKLKLQEKIDSQENRLAVLEIGQKSLDNKLRLTSDIQWIVNTPVLLEMEDGIIVRVQNRNDLLRFL